jgi:acyl-CoA oxidase
VDNGFLQLKQVCIPADHLLARTGQVARDGKYIPPAKHDQHAAYSSMVNIRALLAGNASINLARAATIAVRFLCVRRQFATDEGKVENQLLDYVAVQRRVLPRLCETFALHFTGQYMLNLHRQFLATMDTELLREVMACNLAIFILI